MNTDGFCGFGLHNPWLRDLGSSMGAQRFFRCGTNLMQGEKESNGTKEKQACVGHAIDP
ncbi:hypothetical protein AA12467_2284 [Gluconobacter sphaericus NBRC 12467]|nr:hypothetical protein AA12467_2284 [Gluconobacter sphaericus NBRC 12467]